MASISKDEKIKEFQAEVWRYYRLHRRNFPWRETRDPYRILVSEVMLQQTQVERALGKYCLFLKKFPSFARLAKANLREILTIWQGLGYNRRPLYLKKIAHSVEENYGGRLPQDPELLVKLPGIGRVTAGAICAFAWNKPAVFIETNIRRAFIHGFFPKKSRVRDIEIMKCAARALDRKNPREWHYALMDYGAMLGSLKENPNTRSAHYVRQSPFRGSARELRGKIVKLFTRSPSYTLLELAKALEKPPSLIERTLGGLIKEEFITRQGKRYLLK